MKCHHATLSSRLDSILKKGLLPDAPKLFTTRSSTPSFGGIYYTKDVGMLPSIMGNLAKFGMLTHNDLVILSFDIGDGAQKRIDEDDYFCVENNKVHYVGPEGIDDELVEKILLKYAKFFADHGESNFLALQKEMRRFFDKAIRYDPDPVKGNLLIGIPPKNICVEAVLRPCLGRSDGEDVVVWKALGGNSQNFFKDMFDSKRISPDIVDHLFPYDCCLEIDESYDEQFLNQNLNFGMSF